jgi:hypothetical protein
MWNNALRSSDLVAVLKESSSSTSNRSSSYNYAAARNKIDGTKKSFYTNTQVVDGEVLRRANDVVTYLAPLLANEAMVANVASKLEEIGDRSSNTKTASDDPAVVAFLDSFTME